MARSHHPDRRLLVAVDMQRYSRQDNLRQFESQRIFREVMSEAVDSLGLDRRNWRVQKAGDGELAVLPAATPEPVVVGALVPAIDRILRERNRSLVPEAKVRLRVALHQGLVHLDGANGFPSRAVVEVCRLCDAGPLKRALAAFPAAAVALIVSDEIYRDVVSQRYAGMRPERFARTRVDMADKEFTASAWIHVPDEDVNLVDLDGPDGPAQPYPSRTSSPQGGPTGPAESKVPGSEGGDGRANAGAGETRETGSIVYRADRSKFSGPMVFGAGGTAIGKVVHHHDDGSSR